MGQMLDAAFHFDVGTGQPPVATPERARLATHQIPTVHFDTVTTVSDFCALADEWALLMQNCASRVSIFQTYTWLRHWVDTYVSTQSSNHHLAMVTGRAANGRLVLVAPLQLERHGLVTQLCWMGCPVAQYGDVLVSSEYDSAHNIRAALDVAIETFKPDVVGLCKVRDDSRLAKALSDGWALELCKDMAHQLAFDVLKECGCPFPKNPLKIVAGLIRFVYAMKVTITDDLQPKNIKKMGLIENSTE